MEIVPFKPEHLLQIDPQECQNGEKPKSAPSAAVTILSGDEPAAIFGLFYVGTGILMIWAILSELVRERPIEFHKACLKLLDMIEEQHRPNRIQADVRQDYERGQKWLEALGFQQEGLMKNYGIDGCAHYLYARIPQWQQ